MTKKPYVIYIIDDDLEVCSALKWLFESANLEVQIYHDALAFLEHYSVDKPGCIIVDVRLPVMSGLELIEQLKLQKNYLSVIVITGYGDIPMVIRAMKAGACDFILKPINEQYLLEAVHKCVHQADNAVNFKALRERIDRLSERERQIMDLILEGQLNKQIAFELEISISTVEAHRAHIMQKMQAKNLAHLIKLFLQVQFYTELS